MKYYYSSDEDLMIKMGVEDDKMIIDMGGGPYVCGEDSYQDKEKYIEVKHLGVTYKFSKQKTKKSSVKVDKSIWMNPVDEEKVVKVNNQFCLFEKLSCSDLLQEAYSSLCDATLSAYMDHPMDDPEMTLKLLHRIHWKLKTEFRIPDDEITSFEEIEQEINDIEK